MDLWSWGYEQDWSSSPTPLCHPAVLTSRVVTASVSSFKTSRQQGAVCPNRKGESVVPSPNIILHMFLDSSCYSEAERILHTHADRTKTQTTQTLVFISKAARLPELTKGQSRQYPQRREDQYHGPEDSRSEGGLSSRHGFGFLPQHSTVEWPCLTH